MGRARIAALVMMLLSSVVGTAAASTATPVASDSTYVDPAGIFSVQIPTNWSAAQNKDVGVLSDPDGTLEVDLLTVDASTVDDALKLALVDLHHAELQAAAPLQS